MGIVSELDFDDDKCNIPSAVPTATNYYHKQIELTAKQLTAGESLIEVDLAWQIPADVSKQVFAKNPFLLTKGEAKLLRTDLHELQII